MDEDGAEQRLDLRLAVDILSSRCRRLNRLNRELDVLDGLDGVPNNGYDDGDGVPPEICPPFEYFENLEILSYLFIIVFNSIMHRTVAVE